ncbi:protein-glutamate O-methyltransferase CheR [bacterium]|nr:protein-glutamate O-methyltransferase CheR [bacterium]
MDRHKNKLIERCCDYIQSRSRIHITASRLILLEIALERHVQRCGQFDSSSYLQLLDREPAEYLFLLEQMLTLETRFFRNHELFEAFRKIIVPEIEAGLSGIRSPHSLNSPDTKRFQKPIRIWSAGCSTGEEPYSIAMCIRESMRCPRAWPIEIIACDLSPRALFRARQAYYDLQSLVHIPAEMQKKYCVSNETGFEISADIKKLVSFSECNILQLDQIGPNATLSTTFGPLSLNTPHLFQAIFCCNVLLYCDPTAQQELLRLYSRLLVPGGFLIIGDRETIHIHSHNFIIRSYKRIHYYQKPGTMADLLQVTENETKQKARHQIAFPNEIGATHAF